MSDDATTVGRASLATRLDTQEDTSEPTFYLRPQTRRMIIWALFLICITSIAAEVILVLMSGAKSDALMALASTCVGGIAGLAVPPPPGD